MREEKTNRKIAKESGFTLLEIMIVIAIIAILATIAVGGYRQTVLHAREAALHKDLDVMNQAIQEYIHDKKTPPQTLEDLHSNHYIGAIPDDPITHTQDWVTEPCEDYFDSEQTSASGFCSVHSGSDEVSPFENKPYSEFGTESK